MLKNVQGCRDSRLGLAAGLRLVSRQSWHTCEACRGAEESCLLLHYRTKFLGWPGRQLATQSSREAKLPNHPIFEKLTLRIPFSPHYIQTLIPTKCKELPQRILREKLQRKTKLTHPQSSHRDSSNSSTLTLSIITSLRGTLPKHFLTIPISMRRSFGALGSS